MRATRWFEIILLVTVLATLFALTIPSESPLVIVRYIFGFTYVAAVPGYCLVNLLFLRENKLDLPEEAVLSVALSFGLTGLTGLLLGLSPIGINFASIIVSLSAIVIVLALLAFLRKRKDELRKPQMQSTNSVSK